MLLSVIEFPILQIYIYIFGFHKAVYSVYHRVGIYTLKFFDPLAEILISDNLITVTFLS